MVQLQMKKVSPFQQALAHLMRHRGTELQLIQPVVDMAHAKSVVSK
jgi:hypothetical protein